MWEKIVAHKTRSTNSYTYGYRNCKLCFENCTKEKNKHCDLRASTGAFFFEKASAFSKNLKTRRF